MSASAERRRHELYRLLADLQTRLYMEQTAVYEKERRLRELYNQAVMHGLVMPRQYMADQLIALLKETARVARYVDPEKAAEALRLADELEALVADYRKERELIKELYARIRAINDELLRLGYQEVGAPPPEQLYATPTEREAVMAARRREASWLLEELQAIMRGEVSNGKRAEAIKRRLRELGYPI